MSRYSAYKRIVLSNPLSVIMNIWFTWSINVVYIIQYTYYSAIWKVMCLIIITYPCWNSSNSFRNCIDISIYVSIRTYEIVVSGVHNKIYTRVKLPSISFPTIISRINPYVIYIDFCCRINSCANYIFFLFKVYKNITFIQSYISVL